MVKMIPLASLVFLPEGRRGKSPIRGGDPCALLVFVLIMPSSSGMLTQTLQPRASTKIQCLKSSKTSSALENKFCCSSRNARGPSCPESIMRGKTTNSVFVQKKGYCVSEGSWE